MEGFYIPSLITENKNLIIDVITVLAATWAIIVAYKRKVHKYVVVVYNRYIVDNWKMLTGHRELSRKMDEFINDSKANYVANSHMISALGNQIKELVSTVSVIKGELTTNGGSSIKDHSIKQSLLLERIQGIQWAELYEDSTAIIGITDSGGNVTHVNREFSSVTGRDSDDFLGSNWINVICPEDRQRIMTEWYNAVKYGRDYDGEFSLLDTKDRKIKVEGRAKLLPNKAGYFFKLIVTNES